MAYTTFSQTKNDQLKEPMFFGQSVNVARYDQHSFTMLTLQTLTNVQEVAGIHGTSHGGPFFGVDGGTGRPALAVVQ